MLVAKVLRPNPNYLHEYLTLESVFGSIGLDVLECLVETHHGIFVLAHLGLNKTKQVVVQSGSIIYLGHNLLTECLKLLSRLSRV